MGSRHTMFFMDKEYPNIPMGGGSGGGGGGEATELFTNQTTTNPATITFDEPITNYDFIMFQTRAGANAIATMTYDTGTLVAGDTIGAGFYTGVFAWYYFTDSQTLTFRVSAGGGYISNITGIKLGGGGVSPTPEEDGIILFDGSWKNQDKMGITPYLATIENGELHCQGMHCGIVVSDVSGLPSDYSPYQLIVEGRSQGFSLQAGRCNPTSNLNDIIQQGTNRISYTNDSMTSGNFKIHLNTLSGTEGVFLGGYYLYTNTEYFITKILLAKKATEKTYN